MLRPLSVTHGTRRRPSRRADLVDDEPARLPIDDDGPGRFGAGAGGSGRPTVRTYAQAFGAWRRASYWWHWDRVGLACLCPETASFVGSLMRSRPMEVPA